MRRFPFYFWFLIVLSGLLQAVPFPMAGPAHTWARLAAWICLTPLLYALVGAADGGRSLRLRSAALLSYVCGVIWYLGNCYWIYRTMHIYGDIPKVASMGILLLFSMYLGLYHALFGLLIAAVRQRSSRNITLLAAPFLWVTVELARAKVTGFPWDLLGYTQVDSMTLTRLAPVTGVMGLSFVVALVNALWLMRVPAQSPLLRSRRRLYTSAAAVMLVAVVAVTALHRSSSETYVPTETATLVQVNLGVGAEASPVHETQQQMLASFANLSLHPLQTLPSHEASSLVVWPEAPTDFLDDDPYLRSTLSTLAVQAHAPVIVNDVAIAARNPGGRPSLYNSATVYNSSGTYVGRYDKMHLVPFGEYTPYKPLFFFAGHLLDDLLFVPGVLHTVFPIGGKTYGVFICYESIFGDDIRKLALDGAQVLVNISDDGWYGDTSAPFEHFDMVRMRAIENHRWLIRATNTGITAAIDPLGRVTATYPRHIRGSVQVEYGLESGTTFYTRHGYWFAWVCVVVSLGFLLWPVLQDRSASGAENI